jgi:hypothetical protein
MLRSRGEKNNEDYRSGRTKQQQMRNNMEMKMT